MQSCGLVIGRPEQPAPQHLPLPQTDPQRRQIIHHLFHG